MPLAASQKEFASVESSASYNELLPVVSSLLMDMVVEPSAVPNSASAAESSSGASSIGHSSSSSGSVSSVSVFDGTKDGPMSIQDYLIRMVKYGYCSKETFIIVVIYLDRFYSATSRELTTRNIHRLLLSSFVVAVKLRDDMYYSNSYYATIGGVSLSDMNRMERLFLAALNWDTYVDRGEYEKYVASLAQVKRRKALKERYDRQKPHTRAAGRASTGANLPPAEPVGPATKPSANPHQSPISPRSASNNAAAGAAPAVSATKPLPHAQHTSPTAAATSARHRPTHHQHHPAASRRPADASLPLPIPAQTTCTISETDWMNFK
ncbi:Cyclin-U3-1 [Diplonema papillatum]|nr:Cyclin-U3-1 [Diplonema papillatum]